MNGLYNYYNLNIRTHTLTPDPYPAFGMGRSEPKKSVEQAFQQHPFLLPIDQIVADLRTNTNSGLTAVQAQENKASYGENKLRGEGGVQWYSVLFKQISNAMILVGNPQ